jgi:hypothetical protein
VIEHLDVSKETAIYEEGDIGTELYLIMDGEVEVESQGVRPGGGARSQCPARWWCGGARRWCGGGAVVVRGGARCTAARYQFYEEVRWPLFEVRETAADTYHVFGLIGTALSRKISVLQKSSLRVAPISPNAP